MSMSSIDARSFALARPAARGGYFGSGFFWLLGFWTGSKKAQVHQDTVTQPHKQNHTYFGMMS